MSEAVTTWPGGHGSAAMLSIDVDGEASMLRIDRKYADHPAVMAHASYGPRIGTPRLLRILREEDVRATFFVPGYTAELYPDLIKRIFDDGHEVGCHGYLHEAPIELSVNEERTILHRSSEIIERLIGSRPVGFRAPQAMPSPNTLSLLIDAGFSYDASLPDDDSAHLLTVGDRTIVEIPLSWAHDDWEQYAFLMEPDVGQLIDPPSKVSELWCGGLRASHAESLCFVGVMHPELSGTPARSTVLREVIAAGKELGVWFATGSEIADWTHSLGA